MIGAIIANHGAHPLTGEQIVAREVTRDMLPGAGGLATFSPRLDAIGNSVRGLRVFEELSAEFEMHLFDPARPWRRTPGS